MTQRGPWQVVQTREVYRDPWIAVQIDDVIRPDGHPGIHSIVHIKPGVCVVACDAEHHVHLTEEFHYAVGRVTLEGVSGGIDAGETPLDAARRELREELGLSADTWTSLGVVDPFTANVVSPTQLFLAEGISTATGNPEGTERIQCIRVPLADAVAMVIGGRITHAPTCVLLLRAWLQMRPCPTSALKP
jgi:ADP-ribose pyrophosphatase